MKKIVACILLLVSVVAKADPLPSWNDGATKQSIIHLVQTVTDPANPQFVQSEERIATIDNDGTLWVEQPLYTQFIFALNRVQVLAPQHPEWKQQMPFRAVLSGDKKAIASFSMADLQKIFAITNAGMSVESFRKSAADWLAHTKNPHFNRLYIQDVYQPMLEVMNYLRSNGFNVYIVTGGGQDFVRAYSQNVYSVPPERVIGTTGKTKYTHVNNKPALIKLPEILMVDDKVGKPESINLFIGRKPIIAFGNSDGDREMLEWTQSREGAHLMLLVHHDDAKREYAYGPNSKIGTFSDSLMAEAKKNGWKVISMKNDWKVIFPEQDHRHEK